MLKLKPVQLDAQDNLLIIDQTRLPQQLVYLTITDKQSLITAIKRLQVRGAPAIGIAAAYGIYQLAKGYLGLEQPLFSTTLQADISDICASRPTAINLAWACQQMAQLLQANAQLTPAQIIPLLREKAIAIDEQEAAICNAIAKLGEPLIKDGMGVLTHCNAGCLATSGLGTALAPIYLAQQKHKKFRVYCDETRPLLQGARLTSYELLEAGLAPILICDNMAASLMAQGQIDLVLVGADRVAKNGDVANKIGTLSVAINAAYFGIPFYVCAPSSSLDNSSNSGDDIIIEQRAGSEITDLWYSEPMAPAGVATLNPAFDITPHQLITAIITENGILGFGAEGNS